MLSCMRLCVVFVLCIILPGSLQSNNATDSYVNAHAPFLSIECCYLLKALTDHIQRSTADKLRLPACTNSVCNKLKLINVFVTHTNSMLPNNTFPAIVQSSDENIHINTEILANHYDDLLVLAFLGRAVYHQEIIKGSSLRDLSLEYDHSTDTLRIRDSLCTTDKSIYSAIIGASIALLIFFITNQVIADNASKQDDTKQDDTKQDDARGIVVVKSTVVSQQACAIGLRMPFSSVTV
jgi:hypothetical protein